MEIEPRKAIAMTQATNKPTSIVQTERGLTLSGTRITLYDVMDHLIAGRPPEFILNWLPLTEEQLNAALIYIEENRHQVEAEYQEVLTTAEEVRQYWEEQNRERFARIAVNPPKAGQEALWEKLQAQKARHAAES
jgi:uncharacterized protein (DUF433 family)